MTALETDPTESAKPPLKWHLWPRTVRVRVTIVATLAFTIAISAAAVGLVVVVRDNIVDGIKHTQNEQLDELAAALENNEEQFPTGTGRLVIGADGRLHPVVNPPRPGGNYIESQRVIQTTAGNVIISTQRSLDEVDRTVDSVTRVLLFSVLALIGLVALTVWYFAGRALRPVEAIRAEAAAISGTTIHRRVPEPDTDDEVGRLARTMNAMLDRLELSSQRQRQFVSDASHELRSPLASIRTNLEVALRHSDRADWPAVAQRALAEDQRMEDTVAELLELARLDEMQANESLTSLPEVDLDELVLDETLREHAVPVDTTRVSAGRVHGRREQLSRLVRNLLNNASRHAESKVELSLQSDDGTVELTVDDDGPGVPPEDRDHVFERFTRLDAGRARDAGGLGIGLAIVKSIAEQHGGTVEIDEAPIGGARFVVRLPAA